MKSFFLCSMLLMYFGSADSAMAMSCSGNGAISVQSQLKKLSFKQLQKKATAVSDTLWQLEKLDLDKIDCSGTTDYQSRQSLLFAACIKDALLKSSTVSEADVRKFASYKSTLDLSSKLLAVQDKLLPYESSLGASCQNQARKAHLELFRSNQDLIAILSAIGI
jgi:hypothetical protein